MKSTFTIHAGEFVVGNYIERKFRDVKVWLPSRDTGIDLLVADSKSQKTFCFKSSFRAIFLLQICRPFFRNR